MLKSLARRFASLGCAFLLGLLSVGCGKSGPPTPLALDQIPAAMNEAFARARPDLKELSDRAVASLQNGELGKALMVTEGICATPDLTKQQRDVAARALLALNRELQAAQARGDKEAAELLRAHQRTR